MTQAQTLDAKLNLLDFETDSSDSGLLFTDRDYRGDGNVSFDQVLILQRAQELRATAVYFRRIEGRGAIPQIFVYDNSANAIAPEELITIHRKLWSSGIVPLYYVFDRTEVRIFNCRKPLAKKKKSLYIEPFDVLSLTSHVQAQYRKYSARLFENGAFWESVAGSDQFKADSSSYYTLVDGLRKLRKSFVGSQNEAACNKLLVLSILVKYLEERKDSKGNHVLPKAYFTKFEGAQSFCEVLRKGKCIELFEYLGRDVNGKIFALDDSEKREVAKLDHSKLADFLDANLDGQQYVLWRLYDFNYLPIELISRIYEEFIPSRKDIAYTPTHLVSFMIDECMPLASLREDFRVIDVSCGSGAFLVAAFKQLVHRWQKEQYATTGEVKPPTIRKLKSILRSSIHGIDIEYEAVRLAIFSLTIAVCDMLDPTKMWEELTREKLIDLSDNIVVADFFDCITENQDKFDLVIGNPPFNPPVTEGEGSTEKDERDRYWAGLLKKISLDFEVPDKNIALLFLQQSMKLLKRNGLLSLVMPSGPLLYNNNTLDYRGSLLSKYNVPQIFDFSCLSGVLFHGPTYPVTVIFVQHSPPDDKDILHAVVKRTKTSKEMLFFEIDKYDLYYVPKIIAKTEPSIWKADYLGGGHLFPLLKRMHGLRTLGKFLVEKKRRYGWQFGEGYQRARSTKKPQKAQYLTGKRLVPTAKFTSDFIDDADTEIEKATVFHRPRRENPLIFQGPQVLLKERPDLPVAFREASHSLVFQAEIIGIHSPENEKRELVKLRGNIRANRTLYRMLLLARSGRAGVSRSAETVLKHDIMALPYPDDKNMLKLSIAEQIVCDDILAYGIQQVTEGESSAACTTNADSAVLRAFGAVFCTALNSIYAEKGKRFYALRHIDSPSFICLPFVYGNPRSRKKLSMRQADQIKRGDLSSLSENDQGRNLLFKRIIKLYQRDVVFLIKPKTLRYWLRSIALRDANEVFSDLIGSGY